MVVQLQCFLLFLQLTDNYLFYVEWSACKCRINCSTEQESHGVTAEILKHRQRLVLEAPELQLGTNCNLEGSGKHTAMVDTIYLLAPSAPQHPFNTLLKGKAKCHEEGHIPKHHCIRVDLWAVLDLSGFTWAPCRHRCSYTRFTAGSVK